VSWAAKLLPEIEQQGLWEQITTNNGGPPNANFSYNSPPRLDLFICPSNVSTNEELPLLTYVANTGYFDRQPNSSINFDSDVKANGLFHDLRPERNGPKVRLGNDIKDGASTTLMLSENIHKDEDIAGGVNGWLVPAANLGSSDNWEQALGMVWVYDTAEPLAPIGTQAPISRNPDNLARYDSEDEYFARPASVHGETVNAAFADGSTKPINMNIEYRVYQQIMTPNGAKADALDVANDPPQSNNVKPAERAALQQFMTPPLSDADLN
jgi:prepilin-type processing-associated H-X9-DG protein